MPCAWTAQTAPAKERFEAALKMKTASVNHAKTSCPRTSSLSVKIASANASPPIFATSSHSCAKRVQSVLHARQVSSSPTHRIIVPTASSAHRPRPTLFSRQTAYGPVRKTRASSSTRAQMSHHARYGPTSLHSPPIRRHSSVCSARTGST